MNHQSLYDVMSQMLDPEFRHDGFPGVFDTKQKSFHDYEHDGSIIEYMDKDMEKSYYAVSLGDRYIPLSKDAAAFKSENQIVSVFDYPLDDINEAFWNQGIDFDKAKLVWSRSFLDTEKKLDELDKEIEKLKAMRDSYARTIPKNYKLKFRRGA